MPPTIFAADLGGSKLAAAVVNAQGKFLRRKTEPVDLTFARAPVNQICRLARELAGKRTFSAAGICVPGLVRRSGTVWAPNLPGWNRMPLATLVSRQLGVPVQVESDRNAAVVGEAWRGVARGKSDVVALLVGTGIGAGILSGGRVLRGAHELSGCAGWMVVSEADGDDVRRFGGLEAFASGPALVRAAISIIEAGVDSRLGAFPAKQLTTQDIARLARERDPFARLIFQRAGKLLGTAVANFISLFDPEVVIISGGMVTAADLFFGMLQQTALARCQPLSARKVKIKVSRLGNDANLLGMAHLALGAVEPAKASTNAVRSSIR